MLEHLSHFLPAQAPLEVFVHHNTLHAFQELPFHEALLAAHEKLGAQGYLPEYRYLEAFQRGRITEEDLSDSLSRYLSTIGDFEWPSELLSREQLARLLMLHPCEGISVAGLRWEEEEHDLASSDLWKVCTERASFRKEDRASTSLPLVWPRDLLLAAGGEDPNDLVHPLLTQLAGAFLDRGQSQWPMPDREHGFLVAVRRVLGAGHAVRPSWLASLGLRLRAWEARKATAEQVIDEMLEEINIQPKEREAFLEMTSQMLPGWTGMFRRLEVSPLPTGRTEAKVRLADFFAVRLCLDALALHEMARRLGYHEKLRGLRGYLASLPRLVEPETEARHKLAWPLFQLACHAKISPSDLQKYTNTSVEAIFLLLQKFSEPIRRRIWHEAYERHYRVEVLRGIQARREAQPSQPTSVLPRFQVACCLDDRSESFRRHLEELDAAYETFGTAGFFNLPIAYQGLDDPSSFPLCPVVVSPKHVIREVPEQEDSPLLQRRRQLRRVLGLASARFRWASGSLLLGAFLSSFAGLLAAWPMLASVFAPRFAWRFRSAFRDWLLPAPRTHLSLPGEGAETGEVASTFPLEEKVERVSSLLEELGLTRRFGRFVVLLGHDASSVNNPHFAAYSCGACGGRSGGPNARLFATMANDPEVRTKLRTRNIEIPDTTWFLGGVHDTTLDRVTLFDTEVVPTTMVEELAELRAVLAEASQKNSHERCRRFASAPRDLSPKQAYRHVEGRAFDISQARPELGHATNACCVIGRRSMTRNLFLDRRVFLTSYDPEIDPTGAILERILVAVGPVGAGINLEYFFSTTDNERFGAGTKLPHNVVGWFAVLNGVSGDLRTGLPRQMIEIHEPIRLQIIVEATTERLDEILSKRPALRTLVDNAWVILIGCHPTTGEFAWYSAPGTWEPALPSQIGEHPPENSAYPQVKRSRDWYEGHDDFLPPALIDSPSTVVVRHV